MKENIKAWIIGGYFIIGLFFTVYQNFWGQYSYKSFAYHIGRGIVWPAVMFPSVGKFIGGVLILLIIGALVLRSKSITAIGFIFVFQEDHHVKTIYYLFSNRYRMFAE